MFAFLNREYWRGKSAACGALLHIVLFCLPAAKSAWCDQAVSVERSRRSRPEWVTRVPESDNRWMYFVGRSSGAASLEAAEQDAAANAVSQAVTMTGLNARLDYDRLRSEAAILLQDRLVLRGEAVLEGLKRLNVWYEKTTLNGKAGPRTVYEAHLLVRLPLDAVEKARMKLQQESSERINRAGMLLEKGRSLSEEGEIQEALASFREALDLLDYSASAFNPEPAHQDELSRELTQAVFHNGLELRTILMKFDSGTEKSFPAYVSQALYSAILLEGFTPVPDSGSAGALALPRLSGECVRAASNALEDGFRVCLWNVSLSLFNPATGELVLASEYTAKGFGPDEERADLDALRKIRLETAPRFAREMRERLDLMFGPAAAAGDKLFFAR